MTKKQELRQYIKEGAPQRQKIFKKPKVYGPDEKSQNKNKYKESFGGEGTV